MQAKIQLIQQRVAELLSQDQTGHDMDHINRVLTLSLQFAKQEHADIDLVAIIALLHEVDDYKLFDHPDGELPNAQRIMTEVQLDPELQTKVCDAIQHIGYGKRLRGIAPQTLEGKIVSDADMCDGLGAHGILRTYQYGLSHERPFFRKDAQPNPQYDPDSYAARRVDNTSIDHFFEKILLLKDYMLTPSGKHEAEARHDFVVKFLYQFFTEEDATTWLQYLDVFLTKNGGTDRN